MSKKTEAVPGEGGESAVVEQQVETPTPPTTDSEKVGIWREATEAIGEGGTPAPKASDPPGKTDDDTDEGDGDEEAGEGAGEGEGAGDGGEADPDKEAREKADAEHTAAVDAEAKTLGLKGKAEQRFRELANGARDGAELRKGVEPLLAVAEKEGVPLNKLVPYMIERTERAQEWEDRVLSTGASPEQFGRAMAAIQAVNSNDPIVLGNLEKVLVEELNFVRKRIGKKSDDYNPLDETDNADLKADVQSGELSEARALEMATLRRQRTAVAEQRDSTVTNQAEINAGVNAVRELGADLRDLDPKHFDAKMKIIAPAVKRIQETLPPGKWAGAIKDEYKKVKIAPPAKTIGRVTSQASRGSVAATAVEAKPKDAFDAFRQGVRGVEANTGRR